MFHVSCLMFHVSDSISPVSDLTSQISNLRSQISFHHSSHFFMSCESWQTWSWLMRSDVSMRNLRHERIWPTWMQFDHLGSNRMKWTEMNWNELNWTEMNWTEMKWNEIKFVQAILNLIQFHLIWFDSIWFDWETVPSNGIEWIMVNRLILIEMKEKLVKNEDYSFWCWTEEG
jgi:hypothetical protein